MRREGELLINKLILLFVFDKMEISLSEYTILDMCSSSNNWIAYMDCKPVLLTLIKHSLIYNVASSGDPLYSITPEGRECLANFFIQIPTSIRDDISNFVKNNRMKFRKKQECVADYYMNKDGTYTVVLKIIEPAQPLVDLKFVVSKRQTAKNIYKQWAEKASLVFESLNEILVD